jgi:hypothetical protein
MITIHWFCTQGHTRPLCTFCPPSPLEDLIACVVFVSCKPIPGLPMKIPFRTKYQEKVIVILWTMNAQENGP